MKPGSVRDPERGMGNFWLTMSDASAFTIVRTCIDLASELRRDMLEKAQVLSDRHPVEIALSIMNSVEQGWGREKAPMLITQIVDMNKYDASRMAGVHNLIREAICKLPLTMWSDGKLPARLEFIDELRRLAVGAQATMPTLQAKAEKKEREWRAVVAAMRESDPKPRAR